MAAIFDPSITIRVSRSTRLLQSSTVPAAITMRLSAGVCAEICSAELRVSVTRIQRIILAGCIDDRRAPVANKCDRETELPLITRLNQSLRACALMIHYGYSTLRGAPI